MSKIKQIKLLDGYWIIETNKWHADIYTQEQAEKYADTLINCTNCINCSYCSYCRDCSNCSDCSGCSNCRFCSDCRGCINCSNCSDCSGCSYCSYCRDCRGCINCSNCSDFKTNPERITSPKIGSRNSQSTYYWNDEKGQIVCGCFRGTLEEFEAKVEETHGNNEHAQDYLKWIERIKIHIQVDNYEQQ